MELTNKYFNNRKWDFNELPVRVMIETVMGCNLRCEMCPVPHSKATMDGRTVSLMSVQTYRRILADISDRPRMLHLTQMGEPLLNKNICEFVALSKKDGHTVSFTTNGTLMNQEIARELLVAGIDKVTFSVDGYKASTYESIRIGSNYDKVRSNIESFYLLKQSLGKNTEVQVDCILSDLTKNEIPSMQDYWKGKVDCLNIIPLDDWAGKLELPGKFGLRNWAAKRSDTTRHPCDLLWTQMAISAEGFVMYCCHDYKLLSKLPNINEKPLKLIYKENISEERRKHVEQSIDREPCLHCDAWKTRPPYISRLSEVAAHIPLRYRLLVKRILQRVS